MKTFRVVGTKRITAPLSLKDALLARKSGEIVEKLTQNGEYVKVDISALLCYNSSTKVQLELKENRMKWFIIREWLSNSHSKNDRKERAMREKYLFVSSYNCMIILCIEAEDEDKSISEWYRVIRLGRHGYSPVLRNPQSGHEFDSPFSWEEIKASLRENIEEDEAERLIADYEAD